MFIFDAETFSLLLVTSLLLLAVFDDARCVDEGDSLQQLVGHLDAHQPLQKTLAKLLQGREGP